MDEHVLREKARAVVHDGQLPARQPDRTWGGPGVGAPCTVCELHAESTFKVEGMDCREEVILIERKSAQVAEEEIRALATIILPR